MSVLFDAALELQRFFAEKEWRFCIIGGIAVMRWGEPRFTRDVDATLLSDFGSEGRFISEILARFSGRITDAADFAMRNRVLLFKSSNGVPIDVSLGGLPFEESCIEGATDFEFEPGCVLRTCSAEDLVVMKLFAGRERDWLDVQSVADRMGERLDWDYIEAQLAPLADLKEDPTPMAQLERLKKRRVR